MKQFKRAGVQKKFANPIYIHMIDEHFIKVIPSQIRYHACIAFIFITVLLIRAQRIDVRCLCQSFPYFLQLYTHFILIYIQKWKSHAALYTERNDQRKSIYHLDRYYVSTAKLFYVSMIDSYRRKKKSENNQRESWQKSYSKVCQLIHTTNTT